MSERKKKLSSKELIKALTSVAKTSFQVAPLLAVLQVIGAVLSAALPIVTTFFAALTTTALADAYTGQASGDRVLLYVFITAILGVIGMAWNTFQTYATEMMRYKMQSVMTDRMYDKFFALEFWRYDDKETVDTYEKAQQFATFFPYVFDRLASVFTNLLTMIIAIAALTFVNMWIALIILVAAIPGMIIQFQLSKLTTDHWQKNIETRRRLGWMENGMFKPYAMPELRLYGVVRHLLNMRLALRDKDLKTRIEFEKKYMFKRFSADALSSLSEVVALVWVTLEIIARQQPIGQFLFVQQIVGRALSSIDSVVSTINSIDEDVANLYDYQRFMELPIGINGGVELPAFQNDIRLDHVSFKYPSTETEVLKDISLQINQGERIAIVGENGAGKSTLIKILTGLYAPNSGKVLVDGQNLQLVDVSSWHKQISVLSQDFIRYDFATAKENVWFGNSSIEPEEERVTSALRAAEAFEFVEKLPKGKDSYVDKWMESDDGVKGIDLSGGQWQRIALARNFYRNSSVIILDEPTSAIDALAESRIFNRLFELRDKTLVVISHRLTTVEKSDRIYMIRYGKVAEVGTHRELIKKKGYYYKMFESQLRSGDQHDE